MEHQKQKARVLIFPLSAQGHVTSMLKLAELLAMADIHVTFLNTHYVHDRLLRFNELHARLSRYPGFLFRTISDGLSDDHVRASGDSFMEMIKSMKELSKPLLKEMILSGELGSVTCIIADGIFATLIADLGDELCIPVFLFRTISACCFWPYFIVADLVESGELPIKGEDDMDRLISGVPGMENFLRCRDLPSFCRASDVADQYLQLVSNETNQSCRAKGIIMNSFEDLEGPILAHIRTKCANLYAVGPLHAHLNTRLAEQGEPTQLSRRPNSLFEVDNTCIEWLNLQPEKSVIFVSFGSVVVMTEKDITEFWHGLVNSKKPFLWVVRENLVSGDGVNGKMIPAELVEGTRERGLMVGWVPQEEVLSHRAVGGFLTHSGWNSTLESIVAGVPMLCWPYFADQQINSRYVGEVWKLGIDMKDVCDREIVAKMIGDLMVERKDEFARSMAEMSALAKKSVSEDGSSYRYLDRLINDIKLMSVNY